MHNSSSHKEHTYNTHASLQLGNDLLPARRLDNDGARLAVSDAALLLAVLRVGHLPP